MKSEKSIMLNTIHKDLLAAIRFKRIFDIYRILVRCCIEWPLLAGKFAQLALDLDQVICEGHLDKDKLEVFTKQVQYLFERK